MYGYDHIITQQIFLYLASERNRLEAFLTENGLSLEDDIEYAVGLEDENGTLVGCGCRAGAILKCFAISSSLRGGNLLGKLLTKLIDQAFVEGYTKLQVFTTKDKASLFRANGFYLVAASQTTALLENIKDGPERFANVYALPEDATRIAGAVVMNCNPFTNGHRYLIEYARSQCDVLYLFLVEEDRSVFPYYIRKRLVEEGIKDIPDVHVIGSGPYIISSATFPSYFLKEKARIHSEHAELDASLFASRIAPAFHITKRFVGEEPLCAVTQNYNTTLNRILPKAGIALEVIPRLTFAQKPVSASSVREEIAKHGISDKVSQMVPPSTFEFLKSFEAIPIIEKIKKHPKKEA